MTPYQLDYSRLPRGGVICVVGTRPNFVKAAPILRALASATDGEVPIGLVHTGQHYGEGMQASFFQQLGLPRPHVNLEVGSASHARQTAAIMERFEPVLEAARPDLLIVIGDVNSTLACTLVAAKLGVPVAHVEAGLRSRDWSMPEEINRVLTDRLATLHFTTERRAATNLIREGIPVEGIHFVGNVMIDSLLHHRAQAIEPEVTLAQREVGSAEDLRSGYALVTAHRPSNVDDPGVLKTLLETLETISERLAVVFPVHPRTERALEGVAFPRGRNHRILRLPPLDYLEMLGMMRRARVVLTDSGGIQEETTALGVPCLTMRDNTERPVTVSQGTNILTGCNPERILMCVDELLQSGGKGGRVPELWDGGAGERIAATLAPLLMRQGTPVAVES